MFRASSFTCLVFTLASCIVVAAESDASLVANDYGVFKWINGSRTGYVHPDQEYRIIDPSTGSVGMFATADIQKGKVLAKVPWNLLIQAEKPNNELSPMGCGMVRGLAREMKSGNNSVYAPFVEFAKNQPSNRIPSNWTEDGKELFRQIGGNPSDDLAIPPLEPVHWLSNDWYDGCGGTKDDIESANAALLVVQWTDEGYIVPFSGFYNHRNGKWTNAEVSTQYSKSVSIKATRNIAAGEQIFLSFNKCKECSGREDGYGTAELFRDYGFIEEYPQRWHYLDTLTQFDIDIDSTGEALTITWDIQIKKGRNDHEVYRFLGWMSREIRRLVRLRDIDYRTGNPGMPAKEWEMSWRFRDLNIQAMQVASLSISHGLKNDALWKPFTVRVTDLKPVVSHYDPLLFEFDDINYHDVTCDFDAQFDFSTHREVEKLKSPYQELLFELEPNTKDVVMQLDTVVQISSIYRPHYHEYMVHPAARFLDSVKRVMFVGGGDSMLLHEALKYPELELVVGLELDQTVVRKSFKYFHTQPHFDDPRVEWWFGDATKSLLLLGQEYWQSFDLVLVDLSETVMSLSVTAELDVFDALALLLKPTGIMVKNEQYLEQFSKVFDHTLEQVFMCPILCDQVFVLGSNGLDFLHVPLKDHGIKNLLYHGVATNETRLDYVHDYRRSDAREAGKCGALPTMSNVDLGRRAGIAMLIEAEGITVVVDPSLLESLQSVIVEEGFHPLGESYAETSLIFIMLEEGYVLVRSMGRPHHCSIDIHLWGRFDKLKSLRTALTRAVGSDVVSSYRVVVGGMYGSTTWEDDRSLIGPQIVQARNCDDTQLDDVSDGVTPSGVIEAAVKESLTTLRTSDDGVAVALCGVEDECLALKILNESKFPVLRLSTCGNLDGTNTTTMYDCEIATTIELFSLLNGRKISVFVTDASSPYEMLQVVNSIMSRANYRQTVMNPVHLFMGWTFDSKGEPWRRYFLDRYRRQHQEDPVSRGEYHIQVGSRLVEFGVVSAGDELVNHHLAAVEVNLRDQFYEAGNVNVELYTLYGGKYATWNPYSPRTFLQSDYDETPGLEQYYTQDPLGHHLIVQLGEDEGKKFVFSSAVLQQMFQSALDNVNFECSELKAIPSTIGDGTLMACLNPAMGSVILTWDGRTHVDVSYCRYGPNRASRADEFVTSLLQFSRRQLAVALRDDMPRGTNRVVNMADDLMSPEEVEAFFYKLRMTQPQQGVADEDDDDDEDEYDDEDEEYETDSDSSLKQEL